MSRNQNLSLMDWHQALRSTIDAQHDTVRVDLVHGLSTDLSLQANQDSISTKSLILEAHANIDKDSSGIVIPELNVSGYKEFQVFIDAADNVLRLTVEISPVLEGDVWFRLSDNNKSINSISSAIAQRVRVCVSNNYLTDEKSTKVYLLVRG